MILKAVETKKMLIFAHIFTILLCTQV